MTLGQRIQELRKQKNLSQEQLGEAMGVSRQAISKWEGDLTIPELDKLIALSKFFGLTVGELLGVEQPAPAEEPSAPPAPDWEPVVERYLSAAAESERKSRRWLTVGMAGVAVAALVLAFALVRANERVDSLRVRVSDLQNQVSNLNSSIAHQYSYFNEQLTAMKNQASLVEDYSHALLGVENGKCRLEVTVIPKAYEEGMTAKLTLEGAEGPVTVEGEWNGRGFRFESLVISAGELPLMYSQTSAAGVQQSERLEPLGLRTRLSVDENVSGHTGWTNFYNTRDKILVSYNVEFDITRYETLRELGVEPKGLELVLCRNGQETEHCPLELEQFINNPHRYYVEAVWEQELPGVEGDTWRLFWRMTDSLGQEYKGDVFHFVVEMRNGRPTPVDQPLEVQAVQW